MPPWLGCRSTAPALAVALGASCAGPATTLGSEQSPLTAEVEAACTRLLHSPPHLWPQAMPEVVRHGQAASAGLERALRTAPHAPGAPAVAAALGQVGRAESAVQLAEVTRLGGEAVALEAALALGRLGATSQIPVLERVMADAARPPAVRAAAAAAILAQRRDRAAIAFLCDLILAGTADGRSRGEALGLPVDRPRWALERNLAIDALSAAARPATLELDADASWPRLAAGVHTVRVHFGIVPP